jgi:phosphoribosyl-ATP pyrophosphohydrolase
LTTGNAFCGNSHVAEGGGHLARESEPAMQFSLRTLLIGLTYAAVSMGLLAAVSVQSPSKLPGVLSVILMFGALIVVLHLIHPGSPYRTKYMATHRRPLDQLEQTIAERAHNPSEKSYTSQLLSRGAGAIGAKVVEEAGEVVEAAGEPGQDGREHFVREVGDLVYHLLVLLRHQNCTLSDVEAELARRAGVSGLEEKASRKAQGPGFEVQGSAANPTPEP